MSSAVRDTPRMYKNPRYVDPNLPDAKEDGLKYYRETRKRKNRACLAVRRATGMSTQGLQCDEFPFASTYDSAHYNDLHPQDGSKFSVRYVNSTQNSKAGSALGKFYGLEHVIAMDEFFVQIDP